MEMFAEAFFVAQVGFGLLVFHTTSLCTQSSYDEHI